VDKPMSTNNLNDAQRGLTDDIRRPVTSTNPKEIDKLIATEKNRIRESLTEVTKYNLLDKNPPQDLIDRMQKRTENIAGLTMKKIKNLGQISEKEFRDVLSETEEIAKMPYIDEKWRDETIQNTYFALAGRQKEKLAWQLQKLNTNNHPVWQKAAMESIKNLSLLETDHPGEAAYIEEKIVIVQNKIEVSKELKEKELAEQKKPMEGESQDYSASYKRIQQNPGDKLFVQEKARGIANRGI
jgi:hypothetical protein